MGKEYDSGKCGEKNTKRYYGGYNQSQGGFNAMSGWRQFTKRVKQTEDTDPRFPTKDINIKDLEATELMNKAQAIDGDPTTREGEKMDTAFTRDDGAVEVDGKIVGYDETEKTGKVDKKSTKTE